MKTIDTKSLLLGVLATVLVLTLTSGRTKDEENNLVITSRDRGLVVFNKQTMTIYEFYSTFGGISKTPGNVYKISPDGSSLQKEN